MVGLSPLVAIFEKKLDSLILNRAHSGSGCAVERKPGFCGWIPQRPDETAAPVPVQHSSEGFVKAGFIVSQDLRQERLNVVAQRRRKEMRRSKASTSKNDGRCGNRTSGERVFSSSVRYRILPCHRSTQRCGAQEPKLSA